MLRSRDELPAAYEEIVRRGVDGVLVQPSLSLETAAALAVKHGLASVSFRREFVVAGGLMSLGSDQTDVARMMAAYVDKLLKGARPSDLPVQISTKVRDDRQPEDGTGTWAYSVAHVPRPAPTK